MSKGLKFCGSISILIYPIIIIVILLLPNDEIDVKIKIFWGIIFVLFGFINVYFYKKYFKKKTLLREDETADMRIKDKKYTLKLFEQWFIFISPILIFSGGNWIEVFGIFCMFGVITRIIYVTDQYVYNIGFILLGYKFYLVEKKSGDIMIMCSKNNYSNLKTHLVKKEKVYRLYDNVLYVEKFQGKE